MVSFFPREKFGIAILLNTADKFRENNAITFHIADKVLNLPTVPLEIRCVHCDTPYHCQSRQEMILITFIIRA